MNIFALDNDPTAAARSLCDHIGKMLLESAQLLCNAYDEPSGAVRVQWLIDLTWQARNLDPTTAAGLAHP